MTKPKESHNYNTRVGSKNNRLHVAQSLASIRLAGLRPRKRAISLATLFADGKVTVNEVLEILKSWHNR